MRNTTSLERWDRELAAYLSSRRALGRGFVKEEWILGRFRAFLVQSGACDISEALFERWRGQFYHLGSSARVLAEVSVYNFCRYRRRSDPRVFLPDQFSLARQRAHPLPTLIEQAQVAELLRYVADLASTERHPRRCAMLRLAIALLYTAGLRRGEVVRLKLEDCDPDNGILRIRESKFHKSRWVPLSWSATDELKRYLRVRRGLGLPHGPGSPLLISTRGTAYSGAGFCWAIKTAMIRSRIWVKARRLPRVHDFRHSFAVAALARWYEEDADVQTNLPRLALYMGHVSIASTAYYLRFMPTVVALAGERFERKFGDLVQGGAP